MKEALQSAGLLEKTHLEVMILIHRLGEGIVIDVAELAFRLQLSYDEIQNICLSLKSRNLLWIAPEELDTFAELTQYGRMIVDYFDQDDID